jgi:aquaporin Z
VKLRLFNRNLKLSEVHGVKTNMPLISKLVAEFLGTFWLVLGGCGSAVLAAAFTAELGDKKTPLLLGIAFLGVSLAFGLTVLTMAYAVGHISGGHFNPAVSFGLWAGNRFPAKDLLPYIIAQVVGAVVGGGVIYLIASGKAGFELSGSNPLATNGFGAHSPGGYSLFSAFITEVVLTFFFLIIILGATDARAPQGFAPIPIGLGLTLIHLISIPVTNTSVNPARSTGVALFAGTELIGQLWLFWLAPIIGAVIAGFVYNAVFSPSHTES